MFLQVTISPLYGHFLFLASKPPSFLFHKYFQTSRIFKKIFITLPVKYFLHLPHEHLHLPWDEGPRVFYILMLNFFTGLNNFPLNSHLNLIFDHYNCDIFFTIYYSIGTVPSDERTTLATSDIWQPLVLNNLY